MPGKSKLKFKVSGLSGKWLTPSFFPDNRPTTPGVDEYSSAIVIKVKVKNLIHDLFSMTMWQIWLSPIRLDLDLMLPIYILFSAVQKVVKYKKNFAIIYSLYRYWYQCWRPNKSRCRQKRDTARRETRQSKNDQVRTEPKKAYYYVWSN